MSMFLSALLIFFLRVGDMSLATLRIVLVMRGLKLLSALSGFFQALIYVIAIARVIQDLHNPLNIIGYAAGFGSGVLLGMWVEERLAIGFAHARVISSGRGKPIAKALREAGYGVTEFTGRGRDGRVEVINCTVRRRDVRAVQAIATEADPGCFLTVEEIRPLRRGYWRA